MDQINELAQRVRDLSFAVRLGIAVVIGAFSLQAHIVLARAPSFREIFADLLEGKSLPPIARVYLAHSAWIEFGTLVMALLGIVCLFSCQKRLWSIPLGLIVAIVTIAVTQLAIFAFQLPLIQIISALAK